MLAKKKNAVWLKKVMYLYPVLESSGIEMDTLAKFIDIRVDLKKFIDFLEDKTVLKFSEGTCHLEKDAKNISITYHDYFEERPIFTTTIDNLIILLKELVRVEKTDIRIIKISFDAENIVITYPKIPGLVPNRGMIFQKNRSYSYYEQPCDDLTMDTLQWFFGDGLPFDTYIKFLEDAEKKSFGGNICGMDKYRDRVSVYIQEEICPELLPLDLPIETMLMIVKEYKRLYYLEVEKIEVSFDQYDQVTVTGETLQ